MKKSRFTETQIVGILKEAESGLPMADLLRSHGISGATFYKWRSKYGGLEASELKRVKELEQQLSEYKTMVAELTHDNRALKNLIEKKALAPTGKRDAVDYLVGEEAVPITRACAHLGWLGHRITSAQQVRLRPMNPWLRSLIRWWLRTAAGILGSVLIGCAIRAMHGITSAYARL